MAGDDQPHVVSEPGWVIERSGAGSFRVDCLCGWEESGFDTASLARAAGFQHTTGNRGSAPPTSDGNGAATEPSVRKRWWQRR